MSIKDSTREYHLSKWFRIVKECRNSGTSVKDWCKQNNVDEKHFYYWQRKIRETATETHSVTIKQPAFIEVTVSIEASSPS